MSIPFTQYLLPDGRQRPISIERPDDIEAIARRFIASGGSYEAEVLTTGEISLTACKSDRDVEIEVCANGPGLGPAVDRLVRASGAHSSTESTK